MRERDIFIEALEKEDPAERANLLDEACQADAVLRERVERLLAEHERQESFFLDSPPVGVDATMDQPINEQPGTVIGPYKLLQQIGEGGMGVVFMAEQTEPLKRTVALKIIKPGLDSRQVIARFEAERQALAIMDHPNIAKVFDAGTTESGRPYFVMELVKGVPITTYCDEKRLPVRERLELFILVCQAVQHAHQKGIIHRDIKPSNVLVAEYDEHAAPTVIDFGVAKATTQKLTQRTMFTEFGQLLGTMEYMSPEQAKLNQLDIDTRSDIYSLGVLLYELLTGTTPFEVIRLRETAFDEMLRIIREEDPPKPSTRLSSSESLPSIAADRHTNPSRLSKEVRGELDWVAMKALEKDRNRRYETATGFAADIQRYLADEAVQACPPSAAYRFRQFARRNKAALAIAALVLLFLTILGGSAGWAVRDRSARQARVTGQLELIQDDVARLEQAGKWSEALASARKAEPALAAGEAPPDVQKQVRKAIDDLEFVRRLEEIRAQGGTAWGDTAILRLHAQAEQDYSAAFRKAGINIDTLSTKKAAERIRTLGRIETAVLPVLDDWVAVRSTVKDQAATRRLIDVLLDADPDPWRQRVRDCLARKDWPALENLVKSAELDQQPAATLCFIAAALRANGKQLEHDMVLTRAQRKYPADYWINHRLGINLIWRQTPNEIRDGIGFMRAAVALRPESAHSIMNLGNGYAFLGQYDEAIARYRKGIELNPNYAGCYENLGISLDRTGKYDEAIAALDQVIRLKPDHATAHSELSIILSNCPDVQLRDLRRAAVLAERAVELEPQVSNHWSALGIASYRKNLWHEARTAFDKSLQLGTDGTGGSLRWVDAIDWCFLAMCYQQTGQPEEARQCFDKGVAWMEQHPRIGESRHNEQLPRIRAEAEKVLNITGEEPTAKSESK